MSFTVAAMNAAPIWFISIVPLVLVLIGLILLVLGIRGSPRLSEPHCAKCGYDLRVLNFASSEPKRCSECGGRPQRAGGGDFRPLCQASATDSIGDEHDCGRRAGAVRRQAVSGRGSGPNNPNRSTRTILTSLPGTVSTPWDWQELERRLAAGNLSAAETDAAFDVLIAYLKQERAAGKPQQPLNWAGGFINKGISSGRASQPKVLALSQAYYSPPKVSTPSAARVGQEIKLEVDCNDNPWNIEKAQKVWALKSVVVGGTQELQPRDAYPNGAAATNRDRFSGTSYGNLHANLTHSLPPGEYELTFTFDMGVIAPGATLRGIDGRPGSVEKWPAPLATWQAVVKQKITIVGRADPLVALVTDPALDPLKGNPLGVDEAILRAATGGAQLVIKWKAMPDRPSLPLSYKVAMVMDGQRIPCGGFLMGPRITSGNTSESLIKQKLPDDLKTIDLVFTPDPAAAEQIIGIDRIWGGTFEIKGVPVARYDLEPGKQGTARPVIDPQYEDGRAVRPANRTAGARPHHLCDFLTSAHAVFPCASIVHTSGSSQ